MQIKLAADNTTILWKDEESSKRGSIVPTHDLTDYAQEIQDFAAQVWTAEFIDQWRAEHYPEPTAEEVAEQQRRQYQRERDAALQAITHDFGDGRVAQVRPQDVSNLRIAIDLGVDQEWVMADNTVATLTTAELQAALDSGVMQGKQIWQTYMDNIKAL